MKYVKYVVGLAIISICFTLYYVSYNSNFHEVVKGRVYRSAQLKSNELQKYINRYKFKTIINLRGKSKKEWHEREKETAKINNVELYDFVFSASELPKISQILSLLEILIKAERPLLIHCKGGADRSGMASAIALSIEQNPPLAELKKQFSWRYFVIPFTRSIGPLLFSVYEEWLNSDGRKHDRNNLLFWIKNVYVDYKGNLEYWIDSVQEVIFRKNDSSRVVVAYIKKGPGKISIKGWGFDGRTRLPIENLYVIIDNKIIDKVEYKFLRPDVVKYFNFDKEYYKTVKLGWLAEFDIDILSTGCHTIHLRIAKNESDISDIHTNHKFCFTE